MIDVPFMSAIEKERVLKHWICFIKNGFKINDFTENLYQHLTLHCALTVDYDWSCFYVKYFNSPKKVAKFLTQFDKDYNYQSIEYGGYHWLNNEEYNDLNRAMCDAIEPYKKAIYDLCK